ncbi:galectin-4-like [Mya arenaria]|nr:galectin-4-like [Mya arenaria]
MWATPYVAPIPGGVHDGLVIHVKGIAEKDKNRFSIALQCGDKRASVPFYCNPRFNENQVIRNTLEKDSWGTEERQGGFPFTEGSSFDIEIHVNPQYYSVHVDGNHFCDYSHRLPKESVTHISCEQGIRIKEIRFEGGYLQPTYTYPGSGPIFNPPVPFVHNLGGLYPNKMVVISGIPLPKASRFTINFENGPDIAFHLDVRIDYGDCKNVVVRNSKTAQGYQQEERDLAWFPFSPDAWFQMMIMVEMSAFKVAVNNQHLLEYRHRLQPLGRFDTLGITGDLRLTEFRFQG